MKLTDFDYSLPEDLIAQHPPIKRDSARLMVVDAARAGITHDVFSNLGKYLPSSSEIVVNDSKVIAARLLGRKERSDGQVEVFILKNIHHRRYEAMLRPLKKIREGDRIIFSDTISAVVVDREARVVEFDCDDVLGFLEKSGHVPLPPYIKRPDDEGDRINYQTVYARTPGSVAAPTAGLHFTDELMTALKQAGHRFLDVTLHVNYGTFKPVEVEDIAKHPMHTEHYEISPEVGKALDDAKQCHRKIVAVGTTSTRTIESYARSGKLKDDTNIFIYPGIDFKLIDVLVTNFHLPRSTLLMLVSAFGGMDLIRRAYAEAIRAKYRFYSYGDAMIILR